MRKANSVIHACRKIDCYIGHRSVQYDKDKLNELRAQIVSIYSISDALPGKSHLLTFPIH